jgi:hypothetical protein
VRLQPDDVVTMLTPILNRMESADAGAYGNEPVSERPVSSAEPSPSPEPEVTVESEVEVEREDQQLGPHRGCQTGRYFAED